MVEDKLEQSYASTPGQACTARRAIDATKDFNIKTGKDYAFLAGFKVFSTKDSTDVLAKGDSSAALSFMLEGATLGLSVAATSLIAVSAIIS